MENVYIRIKHARFIWLQHKLKEYVHGTELMTDWYVDSVLFSVAKSQSY